MNEPLLSAEQVGELLGVSASTVRRRTREGTVPYVTKMPGSTGAYLYEREAVTS